MKREVDGVIVEAKSILTALKIIKTVCEDNNCKTCPFGAFEGERVVCKITLPPTNWNITDGKVVWRALN